MSTIKRSKAIDALRGYAILTMVLCDSISNTLPSWMYHTQVPPPDHIFNPSIYGISWVDLVFPFFLFAMGAAMPFSLGRKIDDGAKVLMLSFNAIFRGLQLAFFAIFIQHMYSYSLSNPQNYCAWITTLCAFALLFPMFMRLPWKMPAWGHSLVKITAYIVAVIMLLTVKYADGHHFDLNYSNIIILLLANMAAFGSVIYLLTIRKPWLRIAILPFLMAILLSSTDTFAGSWQKAIFDFTPFPWLYQFTFLKYLFIVIPGTIAGEYIQDWLQHSTQIGATDHNTRKAIILSIIGVGLIICNLYGLFTRHLIINLVMTSMLLGTGLWVLRGSTNSFSLLWKKLFIAGSFLLMLGLFFEAFQGGIRKDDATFSYFFVTSGLAFMALLVFSIVCDYFEWNKGTSFLTLSGQNPMIAYVSADMFLYPVFNIIGVMSFFFTIFAHGWWGLLQGIIITALVTLITIFFSKRKWFWRT
jgi:predicted acyltransferase